MKKVLAVALLSAVAAPAFAGSVDLTGFYAGVSLGQGSASFTAPAGLTVENPTNKPVYGVYGGYRYNQNLAAEVAYTGVSYLYTTTAPGVRYLSKQVALSVAAVGTLPLNDSFSLLGKLGVASSGSENNVAGEQNTRRTGVVYGVGAEYKFTPNVAARLTYDIYAVKATFPTTVIQQDSTAKVVNLGLTYSF